jgi:hypothetical protein
MADCFLALASSFSKVFARSTVSPYPWSMSDFVGISPRYPAQGNNYYLGTRSTGTRLLKVTVTYIYPLLSSPHRFQVVCYRCRADTVIR